MLWDRFLPFSSHHQRSSQSSRAAAARIVKLSVGAVAGASVILALVLFAWLFGTAKAQQDLATLRSAISAELGLSHPSASKAGQARRSRPRNSSIILDSKGKLISYWGENLRLHLPLPRFGKVATKALIAAEDQRFRYGLGIDPIAIGREALRYITKGSVSSGASTITSQLVKDLLSHKKRSLTTKLREFGYGFYLHRSFSAQELLTAYTNRVYLGQRCIGFAAAAWRYYGRAFEQLNTKEQLSLIALVPSPSRNNPMYSRRNHQLVTARFIKRLSARQLLSQAAARTISAQPLRYDFAQLNPKNIGYFRNYVSSELRRHLALAPGAAVPQGLRVSTSYDSHQHRKLSAAFAHGSFTTLEQHIVPKSSAVQAAGLWVDSGTGAVTTMIGGRRFRDSRFNRTLHSLRSPGSTLKPIILALAIRNGFSLKTRFQNYRYHHHPVKNQSYDPSYLNLSLLEGFTMSSNHLMLRLGETIGLKPFLRAARSFGITTTLKPEWGSIIGSSEVSMFDLARLYSTIAQKGLRPRLHGIRSIEQDGKVVYEAAKEQVAVIQPKVAARTLFALRQAALRGVGARSEARQLTYGGKTGTSNGMRDNWYCGISHNRVGVVWVGADEGQGFPQLAGGGARFALPLWLASLPTSSPKTIENQLLSTTTANGDDEKSQGAAPGFVEFIDLSGETTSQSIDGFFAPVLF